MPVLSAGCSLSILAAMSNAPSVQRMKRCDHWNCNQLKCKTFSAEALTESPDLIAPTIERRHESGSGCGPRGARRASRQHVCPGLGVAPSHLQTSSRRWNHGERLDGGVIPLKDQRIEARADGSQWAAGTRLKKYHSWCLVAPPLEPAHILAAIGRRGGSACSLGRLN